MNQDHVLLVFKFPELDDEYTMPYLANEVTIAKEDAVNFYSMYDEVLYVFVVFVFQDGREEMLFQWNNPRSEKLISRANSAGAVLNGYPMSMDFVRPAGTSSPKSSNKSSPSPWGARPPSAEQYEAPPPSASKTYAGRHRRRTSRSSNGQRK